MQFDGAVVREQGITFAVVAVKPRVVDDRSQAAAVVRSFGSAFPGMPVILMGQGSSGRTTYFGRADITRFLAHISPGRLPWKRYTVN